MRCQLPPLSRSGKVLVQVGTTERPTGWKTRPAELKVGEETRPGELILNFGTKPWQIVQADVKVTLANPVLQTAHVLDANGMPVKELPLADGNGGKTFAFPPDALYVVLQ